MARMSRLPNSSFTEAKAAAASSGEQRSGQIPITRPSYSESCARALSTDSFLEPATATLAPFSRYFFTMAKPIPLVPPVTMAVFPVNMCIPSC